MPEPNTGCWLWFDRAVGSKGYGQISVDNVMVSTHRASYEAFKGAIPKGLIVRHKCDTPACVNPDHLEIGTKADNAQDMVSRGRSLAGERHPRCKIRRADVERIRELRQAGVSLKAIGDEYGMAFQRVWAIVAGQTRRAG